MDNLFRIRVLTTSVNNIQTPQARIFNRYFRSKGRMEVSDRLAFDIISGNETLLKNISIHAPATVTPKTGRTTVTLQAPRLSHKRFIHASELNAMRAYGEQNAVEMLKDRIAREQNDMNDMIFRTLEFWSANALKGKVYDSDLKKVLVDYNLDATHNVTLTGTDLWTDTTNSDPMANLRTWQALIEDDSGASITSWFAYVGRGVMSALINHDSIRELLRYNKGVEIAEDGNIKKLVDVSIEEYNGSYLDDNGTRRRFINTDQVVLIGECAELVDLPFAPIIDIEAPNGVGNIGTGGRKQMLYSKSWEIKDPSGRWMKVEGRPIPVLKRPGAVVVAKVV